MINAAQYGVPLRRESVIIIGIRKNLGFTCTFPNVIHESEEDFVPLRNVVECTVDEKYFFSEWAMQGILKAKKDMNKGRTQHLDKPCNTVGSYLAKVSLNSTDPVLYENGKYRRFTPREVARIQSFPEEFELVGSENSQYKALGNAIPPVMFWHITNQLVVQLKKEVKE